MSMRRTAEPISETAPIAPQNLYARIEGRGRRGALAGAGRQRHERLHPADRARLRSRRARHAWAPDPPRRNAGAASLRRPHRAAQHSFRRPSRRRDPPRHRQRGGGRRNPSGRRRRPAFACGDRRRGQARSRPRAAPVRDAAGSSGEARGPFRPRRSLRPAPPAVSFSIPGACASASLSGPPPPPAAPWNFHIEKQSRNQNERQTSGRAENEAPGTAGGRVAAESEAPQGAGPRPAGRRRARRRRTATVRARTGRTGSDNLTGSGGKRVDLSQCRRLDPRPRSGKCRKSLSLPPVAAGMEGETAPPGVNPTCRFLRRSA